MRLLPRNIPKALAGFAAMALTVAACSSTGGVVSQDRIEKSAEEQWTQLLSKMALSDNETYLTRTKTVSERILNAAGENPDEWRIAVFDEDNVYNAFALPNKTIGVFSGILTISKTDDQLATVLGHEVAHVRLNHAETRVNRELAPRILIGVTSLPGEVVGVGAVKTVGAIAGAGVAAGAVLPFERNQELEADAEGLKYLAAAGFDPTQAPDLWRNISKYNKKGGGVPEFLSTHPSDERRIRKLEQAAQDLSQQ